MLNPFLKSIVQAIGNNRYLPTLLPTIKILMVVNKTDRDRYIQHLQANVVNGVRSYCFFEAETIEEGLNLYRSQKPDVILLDLSLPNNGGLKFLTAIDENANSHVIVLTEQSNEGMAARAMKFGAVDYLIKEDITEISLSACVHQICDRLARTRQLQAKIHHLQSKQQRASILLSESEQRYKSLASSVPVGIFRKDSSGQCIYVNDRYCQIAGLIPEAALGDGWRERLYPDDREMLKSAWQQSIQNNCPFQLEYRFQHADGKVVWVYGQYVTELDDKGEILGYVGTVTDISDRKQAEIALKKSEAHQRALISAIPDLIMRMNRSGIYLEFIPNENFRIVGNIEEMTGTHVFESLPLNEAQKRLDSIQLALQTNTIQTYEQDLSVADIFQIEEVRVVPYSKDEVILLVRDISDRKQAERALKKSESNSRAILATIPDLMFRIGSDGIHRGFTSKRDFAILPQHFDPTGYSITGLLPPELAERHLYYTQQAIQTGELQVYEQQIQIGDRLQDEEVRVIKTGDDEVLFMIRDISDRKQAERALKKSESNSRAILTAIPDLLFRLGSDGIYRGYVTEREFDALLDVCDDPVGYSMMNLLTPEVAERHLYYVQQAIQTGELQVYEQQIQIDDRLQDEEVRVIKTGDDEVLFMIRDISDRKQAERALKKSEITNRAIIETIPDLLIQMDLEGRYLSILAGSGVRIHYPCAKTDIIHDILPDDLAKERLHYANQAIATGSLQVYEQIFTFDDEQRYEEVRIAPLNDHEVLVIVRDITDAKRAEVERLDNAELRRATRLKDEFLANMSHELRTPLNGILGMTEGLLEQVFGEINERQIKALQTVQNSGSHLLELINDILDIAKIESGQMELNRRPTAITSLCQSSLAFVRQQAIAKRIQIKTQLPTNLPDLLVDELRVRQVLINLLNNAVKFTMEGGQITLEASFISQSDELLDMKNYLQIAITDTGIGISPENIKKLFQPFIQIDSALNRRYEGTGLGLALVKQIVELHGGTVGLTSELGVGSCFTVSLPYVDNVAPDLTVIPQAEPTHEPSSPNRNNKFSILIADDNAANVETISSYLEAYGYHLLIANDGVEAIALTKAHHPDIILMDIQMPVMDGLEAIQQIRFDPNLINIPIIALTALAMTGDQDRCLAAGANEYLSKPVKLKELVATIQKMLSN